MTKEGKESVISVTLEDGSVIPYVMRGLTEEEIQPWADFCASVFSYKANPPPPSYFERHYYNDPRRDASLVRVIFYGDTVVSSCRIFQREISMNTTTTITTTAGTTSASAGGIGEVCTHADHRKRGLSKILLHDAIRIMTSRGMKLSLLHAAPEFFAVYEKSGGYACVRSEWSLIAIDCSKLDNTPAPPPFQLRLAQFPQDTARLQELHKEYSERRFVGCIVRSKEYWNTYISKELEGSLWTLVKENEIVAWLSVRERGDRYQLRDFGNDASSITTAEAMSMLLSQAAPDKERMRLHLPTAIVEEIHETKPAFVDWTTLVAEDDHGWMYKTLQADQKSISDAATRHLIWPADSF